MKLNKNFMKFIFRGNIVFEYQPEAKFNKVIQHKVKDILPAFDYCRMIPEDYKLLGEFFSNVYKHIQGENVELKDIEVN